MSCINYSLNRNCLDTLLSSCPPNVGVQDFGLTAINNIGRTRRQARSKKRHWVEVSQLFLSETGAHLHYTNNKLKLCLWWKVHLAYPASLQALHSSNKKQIIQIVYNRIKKPN